MRSRVRKPQPEAETPRGAPKCPFCASHDAEVISLFGTQAMTLQYRCRACGSLYEAIRYDRAEVAKDPPRSSRRAAGGA
jgi:transposase-like protein